MKLKLKSLAVILGEPLCAEAQRIGKVTSSTVELTPEQFRHLKSKHPLPARACRVWPEWAQAMAKHRLPGDSGVGATVEHHIGLMGSPAFKAWHRETFGERKPCPNCPKIWNSRYPYA